MSFSANRPQPLYCNCEEKHRQNLCGRPVAAAPGIAVATTAFKLEAWPITFENNLGDHGAQQQTAFFAAICFSNTKKASALEKLSQLNHILIYTANIRRRIPARGAPKIGMPTIWSMRFAPATKN
ncbi:MAG: hypothetical protein E5X49_00220 [Mesorhizobium sp.]|uniref:hypothetical protein n=1 Tax=Mesorhizobium sp. TaxID=1871066 RepID=UPI000FE95977|nr:hypothetical protein [Mesorhizobium sp.]RWG87930.1 MAG: hypothetical protein EOQ69_02845 [Mesorhizobium sp.]RWK12856.1 MAG: hypothetical protein EOR39_04470 [Mesorhizobium sp.]TIQ46850.1 MAG: hypothetical protein E5X49_00220 [Mesorhizobium sp.]